MHSPLPAGVRLVPRHLTMLRPNPRVRKPPGKSAESPSRRSHRVSSSASGSSTCMSLSILPSFIQPFPNSRLIDYPYGTPPQTDQTHRPHALRLMPPASTCTHSSHTHGSTTPPSHTTSPSPPPHAPSSIARCTRPSQPSHSPSLRRNRRYRRARRSPKLPWVVVVGPIGAPPSKAGDPHKTKMTLAPTNPRRALRRAHRAHDLRHT